MKTRLAVLATAGLACVLAPSAAHAGAIVTNCSPDGRIVIESTDHAVVQYPKLWDFEIR
jgi:hypothetical protein